MVNILATMHKLTRSAIFDCFASIATDNIKAHSRVYQSKQKLRLNIALHCRCYRLQTI